MTTRKLARSLIVGGVAAAVAATLAVVVPASAAATVYEAESATISQGAVNSDHAGFTGSGFVNYNNVTGSHVEFTVPAAQAQNATLTFRYANGTTTNRPMTVSVNGSAAASGVAFAGTGSWTTWRIRQVVHEPVPAKATPEAAAEPLTDTVIGRLVVVPLAYRNVSVAFCACAAGTVNSTWLPVTLL